MGEAADDAVLGVVLTFGPGPIPAATVAAAQGALSEVVVVRLSDADPDELRAAVRGRALVLLIDSRCEGLSADVLAEASSRSADRPVVYVQPVLETLKLTRERRVVGTVDREQVRVVATPVVVPGEALVRVADLPAALADPVALVRALRELGPVELREAPPHVRRTTPPDQTSLA